MKTIRKNKLQRSKESLYHFSTKEGRFFRTAYSPQQAKDMYVIDCLNYDKVIEAVRVSQIDFSTFIKAVQ